MMANDDKLANAAADVTLGELHAPRYTDIAFPPYRFVQGKTPHPIVHPEGHSYRPPGAAEPRRAPVRPQDWAACTQYLYGIDLYNHGYWWEAHESLEAVWQTTDKQGAQGRFLQGLIQVAAGQLKLHTRTPRGVRHYLTRGTRHLSFARAHAGQRFMGLDIDDFLARVTRYFAAMTEGPVSGWRHDPEHYPFIRLESRE
jgi:hypothetical protein